MIVEYTRYTIPDSEQEAFEAAYREAAAPLAASPHCQRYELARCSEDVSQYVLRIEWDSAEGHLQGFRQSQEFRSFFTSVRPFTSSIEEMRHYDLTGVVGDGAGAQT